MIIMKKIKQGPEIEEFNCEWGKGKYEMRMSEEKPYLNREWGDVEEMKNKSNKQRCLTWDKEKDRKKICSKNSDIK